MCRMIVCSGAEVNDKICHPTSAKKAVWEILHLPGTCPAPVRTSETVPLYGDSTSRAALPPESCSSAAIRTGLGNLWPIRCWRSPLVMLAGGWNPTIPRGPTQVLQPCIKGIRSLPERKMANRSNGDQKQPDQIFSSPFSSAVVLAEMHSISCLSVDWFDESQAVTAVASSVMWSGVILEAGRMAAICWARRWTHTGMCHTFGKRYVGCCCSYGGLMSTAMMHTIHTVHMGRWYDWGVLGSILDTKSLGSLTQQFYTVLTYPGVTQWELTEAYF